MDISKFGINMNEIKQEIFSDKKLELSFLFIFLLIMIISTFFWYLNINIENFGLLIMIFAIITVCIFIPIFHYAYKSEEKKDAAPLTNYIGIFLLLFMIFISFLLLSIFNLYFYSSIMILSLILSFVFILNLYGSNKTKKDKNLEMSK
jgi:hypothetical protein